MEENVETSMERTGYKEEIQSTTTMDDVIQHRSMDGQRRQSENRLTDDEWKEIEFCVESIKRKRENEVSGKELRKFLQFLGMNPTIEDIKDIMAVHGMKKKIFTEDLKNTIAEIILVNRSRRSRMAEELEDAFKAFDLDGNGTIDRRELREALMTTGEKLQEYEVDLMFAKIDTNGDGSISYEEFVKEWSKIY